MNTVLTVVGVLGFIGVIAVIIWPVIHDDRNRRDRHREWKMPPTVKKALQLLSICVAGAAVTLVMLWYAAYALTDPEAQVSSWLLWMVLIAITVIGFIATGMLVRQTTHGERESTT